MLKRAAWSRLARALRAGPERLFRMTMACGSGGCRVLWRHEPKTRAKVPCDSPPSSSSFLLVAALSAQAAAPVQHATKSPAEVAAYWTKDRMRNAIPRDVVRSNGAHATAGKPGGGGRRRAGRASRSHHPLLGHRPEQRQGLLHAERRQLRLLRHLGRRDHRGHSLVWTAGHCVHEGPGSYATNFMFVPAYIDGTRPVRQVDRRPALQTTTPVARRAATSLRRRRGVASCPEQRRAAEQPRSANIQAPRPMAFSYGVTVNSTRFKSYGYPAAGKFNGQRMYMCDSPVVRRDGSGSTARWGSAAT